MARTVSRRWSTALKCRSFKVGQSCHGWCLPRDHWLRGIARSGASDGDAAPFAGGKQEMADSRLRAVTMNQPSRYTNGPKFYFIIWYRIRSICTEHVLIGRIACCSDRHGDHTGTLRMGCLKSELEEFCINAKSWADAAERPSKWCARVDREARTDAFVQSWRDANRSKTASRHKDRKSVV